MRFCDLDGGTFSLLRKRLNTYTEKCHHQNQGAEMFFIVKFLCVDEVSICFLFSPFDCC